MFHVFLYSVSWVFIFITSNLVQHVGKLAFEDVPYKQSSLDDFNLPRPSMAFCRADTSSSTLKFFLSFTVPLVFD